MAKIVTIEDPPSVIPDHLPPNTEVREFGIELSDEAVRAVLANATTRIIMRPVDAATADQIASSIGDQDHITDTL